MGWLILKVGDEVVSSTRHPLRDPALELVAELLEEQGLELGPVVGAYRPQEWPITVEIYTSQSRLGIGRSGSRIYTWPARAMKRSD